MPPPAPPPTDSASPPVGEATGAAKEETERPVRFAEIFPLMRLADMMAPMAVRAAATLRLADHIAAGATTLEELASAAGVDADALRRLLRYLIVRGVFTEPRPRVYALNDLSRFLLDDHRTRLRARFDLHGPVGRGDLSFIHLLDSIETGQPSFAKMYGRSFWEDLNDEPGRAADFAAMMAANVEQSGIDTEYDWSGVNHVVDVGGGNGTLVADLLIAHPHLHATIVELGATAERARHAMTEAGLAQRCDVVTGSFFDPLPAGADVYLLCKILHDWGDRQAVAILRRCVEAAGPTGRVLIIENVAAGDESDEPFTYLDLHMLVYFGGRERTVDEYRELAAATGMSLELVGTGKWGSSILESTPSGTSRPTV